MPVSAKQKREAVIGTRKKGVLARKLEKKLATWNVKVVKAFRASYPMTQLPTVLQADLSRILTDHYFEVVKVFSLANLQKGLQKQVEQEIDRVETDIAKKVIKYIEESKELNIQSITTTTDEVLAETIAKAQQIASDEDEPLTIAAISLIAARLLKKRLDGRLPVIGITETNWPSEGTKAIHVNAVVDPLEGHLDNEREFIINQNLDLARDSAIIALGISKLSYSETARNAGKSAINVLKFSRPQAVEKLTGLIAAVKNIFKTWVTMGDSRVREAHSKVNGQTVRGDQPFLVDGELLRYPSDRSLGASLGNIIG